MGLLTKADKHPNQLDAIYDLRSPESGRPADVDFIWGVDLHYPDLVDKPLGLGNSANLASKLTKSVEIRLKSTNSISRINGKNGSGQREKS